MRAVTEQDDVRNIALTGPYGTGKSSILEHLAESEQLHDRVLQLSLSTVGDNPARRNADGDDGDDGVDEPAVESTTNLIQKEIVKQILYRDEPGRTRGSRFRRISRFRWPREIGLAVAAGALIAAVMYLLRLLQPVVEVLQQQPLALTPEAAYAAVVLVVASTVAALRWVSHNRIFLERLSAGPATVALSDQSSSYFDKYMDEIVYYFEQSGRDIVVFEDIDRFENVEIFEALRALNGLLNGSEQVRNRRRPGRTWFDREPAPDVKFIYALRDSVFEQLGSEVDGEDAADDEVKRANRTKFFDLVIPVVPFITHRNARDLMARELTGTGVSAPLVNLAAQHVADMRLIKSMRNEYDVYASRLLDTPSRMPGLDPDRLFAMILYKSVHMGDFERIRFGKSRLDQLHAAWREIVNTSLAAARKRERDAADLLARHGISATRAAQLGARLENVVRAIVEPTYRDHWYIQIEQNQYRAEEVRQASFWTKARTPDTRIIVASTHGGGSTVWTPARLETLMGYKIDPVALSDAERPVQTRRLASARDDIRFLRHHTWQEIHARTDFTHAAAEGEAESFAAATHRLLQSRLARALVAGGYINDYFALYISQYYGDHLRRDAQNYIVHALDRGAPDINYPLEPDDVEAIITDKGPDILGDRAAYNIAILDHLLVSRPGEAALMVAQIAAWEDDDRAFLEQYLQAGAAPVRLIEMLTPRAADLLRWLIQDAPLSGEQLAPLVEAVLASTDDDVEYAVPLELDDVVRAYAADFTSLRTDTPEEPLTTVRATRVVDSLARFGCRLPDTSFLSDTAREAVIRHGGYDLTARNLRDLTSRDSLALDSLVASDTRIAGTALKRIGEYLDMLATETGSTSVDDADQFARILASVDAATGKDTVRVSEVVRRAAASCAVPVLADAPESAWASLAASKRTDPSARNLLTYLDEFDEIDENVAALIEPGFRAADADDLDDAERTRLATHVLNAEISIPRPADRVSVATSLHPPTPLPPASFTPESGERAGLMLAAGLIADDASSFLPPVTQDWETWAFAAAKSRRIIEFLTPQILPSPAVRNLFDSAVVPDAVKTHVLARLDSFAAGAARADIRSAVSYAVASGATVQPGMLEFLRAGGAEADDMVRLVARLVDLPLGDLRAFLRRLPPPYVVLADPGTERPLVPDEAEIVAVLDRLATAGVVSSHRADGGRRRVALRHPA
ncbi:hypothetical protein ASD19_12630 [Microbacterium sp. Root53]|nr:hypothetical protein ASD19_12630 [Microbacterium sp. Root53]